MTAAKSTYRRRRTGSGIAVPKYIARWFAGERSFTFHACGKASMRLRDYWAAWKESHPEATPPANFETQARVGDVLKRLLASVSDPD
jgi:hypothetical protein